MKIRRSNWQIVVSGVLIFAVWFGALPVYAQTRQDGKGVGVKVVSELPSKEKRWALIVGIDEYQNDVSTLKGSVNDAKALKNVLVNNAGFPENQIILLTTDAKEPDKQPTRENILKAFRDLHNRVDEESLLLFSFSGHGVSINESKQAFLIPSNGSFTKNSELLEDFSIDVSRIKRAIELMKVKQVLMLLDACRNEPGKGDTPNRLTDAYKNGFSFDVANSDVKAFATLYATSIGERAYEFYDKDTKQFRGYFSHAVEEALKGKAANEKGEVTLSRLIDYLETTVPKKVKYDKGETQIPTANYSETYKANQLILAVAKTSNSDIAIQQPKPSPSPSFSTNPGTSNNRIENNNSTNLPLNSKVNIEKISSPKVGDIIKNSIGMEFVWIPSGEFMMGILPSDRSFVGSEFREPPRLMKVGQVFWIGKYEVTRELWKELMGKESRNNNMPKCDGINCPMKVSWDEAKEFIQKLNSKDDEFLYRLPSEAEWEYAARAGTNTMFYWGDDIKFKQGCQYANAADLSKKEYASKGYRFECRHGFSGLAPVGSLKPNGFGLYDISGNLAEWVEDIWSESRKDLKSDESPNLTIGNPYEHVIRGGTDIQTTVTHFPWMVRSSYRERGDYYDFVGFRIVAVPKK